MLIEKEFNKKRDQYKPEVFYIYYQIGIAIIGVLFFKKRRKYLKRL